METRVTGTNCPEVREDAIQTAFLSSVNGSTKALLCSGRPVKSIFAWHQGWKRNETTLVQFPMRGPGYVTETGNERTTRRKSMQYYRGTINFWVKIHFESQIGDGGKNPVNSSQRTFQRSNGNNVRLAVCAPTCRFNDLFFDTWEFSFFFFFIFFLGIVQQFLFWSLIQVVYDRSGSWTRSRWKYSTCFWRVRYFFKIVSIDDRNLSSNWDFVFWTFRRRCFFFLLLSQFAQHVQYLREFQVNYDTWHVVSWSLPRWFRELRSIFDRCI